MKQIIKLPEPEELFAFKAKANDDWKPTFDNLETKVKNAVKESLMNEQGHICCYCERRVFDRYSHIEHFRPQHDFPERDLDYENLHCSCFPDKENVTPLHCGPAKDDKQGAKISVEDMISPLDPECESAFVYLLDGKIEAAGDSSHAGNTIKKLRLDCDRLIKMRANAIEPFIDDSLELDEFRRFVESYLEEGENGKFQEFHRTIAYLFLG
jgi:uncharacterized protein (TIGR02646 family)